MKRSSIKTVKTCRYDGKELLTEGSMYDYTAFFDDLKAEMIEVGGYIEKKSDHLLTTEYAEKVVAGLIPACKRNIKACERHLHDLKRSKEDPTFSWVFNEEKGHRVIRFIENQLNPIEADPSYRPIMQPWEHFVLGSEFGWVLKTDSTKRRFIDALEFIPRKNRKTSLAAMRMPYMAAGLGENSPVCVFIATTKDVADIGFNLTKDMMNNGVGFDNFKVMETEITNSKGARIFSVSADAGKGKKDGYNPFYVVFDEIHGYTDFSRIKVYKSGRGGRTNNSPLFVYCTSGGYVLDGPLIKYLSDANECFEDFDNPKHERFFFFISELDSEEELYDASTWIKANINMLAALDFPNFVNDYRAFIDDKTSEEYREMLTKNFNFFKDGNKDSYVDSDIVFANNKVINREDLRGKLAFIGYDLADTEDFSAVATMVPLENGEVYIECKSFIPQYRYDSYKNKPKLDKYEAEGSLVISGDSFTKYKAFKEYIKEQSEFYRVFDCGYDNMYAVELNHQLEGILRNMTKVNQKSDLKSPLKEFRKLLISHKLVFNNDAMFQWYLGNAQIKVYGDDWALIKPPNKGLRKNDGVSAALNAYYVMNEHLVKNPIRETPPSGGVISFGSRRRR